MKSPELSVCRGGCEAAVTSRVFGIAGPYEDVKKLDTKLGGTEDTPRKVNDWLGFEPYPSISVLRVENPGNESDWLGFEPHPSVSILRVETPDNVSDWWQCEPHLSCLS